MVTLTGRLMAYGAPAGTFARTRPAISTVTVRSRGWTGFSPTSRVSSMVRPENTPSGTEPIWIQRRMSVFNADMSENTPAGTSVKSLPPRLTVSSADRQEKSSALSDVRPTLSKRIIRQSKHPSF